MTFVQENNNGEMCETVKSAIDSKPGSKGHRKQNSQNNVT